MLFPFPDDDCSATYDREAWPFVCDPKSLRTHPDPDWRNFTYGDNCHNWRAKALLSVEPEDILLFWALFWKTRRNTAVFHVPHSERRWCIFGSLTIKHLVKAERERDVPVNEFVTDKATLQRAIKNAHVRDGNLPRITSKRRDVLFIGDPSRSARFNKAVDLEVYRDGGLLQKTILAKDARPLRWDKSPRWNSSLRPCRAVLDLSQKQDQVRAQHLRNAIMAVNPGFDLLRSRLLSDVACALRTRQLSPCT